ncbi:uncharacterized protein M421DRAFT_127071 [Didymella exigua CBS 183.55]|uniref:Uncharacterized protein n=1 Tax=Didymella exigua CBS 183.55 TaxID=1150837 RepID=A0A6A5RRM6_9PLEO|nr:uncharacterized protein M421DRAFT_127071 [Didymella exigua CBS 183.55]KAF1929714.1 hypothetical protein M421DRAFT_127071 [Didymella exigua CBS 183.55]
MTTMARPQPHPRQHAFLTARNLLNLDCSADLKSYRRDLGPGVQAKCFEKTSDTIRAQLDDHRAFLLRHRQNGQASGFPSPVPRLEPPPSHAAHSSPAQPHMSSPNNNYHIASHPRPLSVLSQPHAPRAPQPAPSPSRPQNSVPGRIATYPASLRQALERGRQYGHRHEAGYVYEVIVHVSSQEYLITKDRVGAYESLQDANMEAVGVLLSGGYYGSALDEPTCEVEENGALRFELYTDGFTGGQTEIYVKRARARQGQITIG